MEFTVAGHDVSIRRPARGRWSNLIQHADECARKARIHGTTNATNDDLLTALTEGSMYLRQLCESDLQLALEQK